MRAVGQLVAHELASRWRGWVTLALLTGLAGAVVLAAAAGARRTSTAYPRFLRASRASDMLISPAITGAGGYYAALARLPGVRAAGPVAGINAVPLRPNGLPGQAVTVAPLDGSVGHRVEIPKLLAGRLPRPGRPGEAAVDETGARALHLRVGQRLVLGAVPGDAPPRPGQVRKLSVRVTGIMVTRGSVVPVNSLDEVPTILASTALARQLGPRYRAFDGAYVALRRGTPATVVAREAQALARRFPRTGGQVFVADERAQAAVVERSIRPQAVALYLFALVFAITALLIVGQAAVRQLLAAASDYPALAALGMTRRQLTAAALLPVAAAAATGALLAVGAAVAASPLMPIGPARLAEPDPGISADATVLSAGAAGLVVLLVARVAWPAWRAAAAGQAAGPGRGEAANRPPGVAGWLARTGLGVTAVTGTRFALDPGRGRGAVPVRSALAGTALSVLTVTAVFTFGANLLHLTSTPRLYGKSWDVAVDLQFSSLGARQLGRVLAAPGLAGWSFGNHGIIRIGRDVIPAVGLAPGHGPLLAPVLLRGRQPRTAREIVLGTSVLRRIGRRVGQSVTVIAGGPRQTLRIVGQAVFPAFGQGSFTPTDLGDGAETTASLLAAEQVQGPVRASGPQYSIVLLRFAPGPRRAARIAGFRRSLESFCEQVEQSTCVVTDQRPNGVTGYARIDGTPEVLAGVLAVLGLAVLAQLIVLSGRRRRRDLAILKVLGLRRWQLSAIVAWQVSTLAVVALAAGLPLGAAVGRWAWALFADGLGVSPGAIVPVPVILVTVPALLLAANAVGFWPGRVSARLHPAAVLRAE